MSDRNEALKLPSEILDWPVEHQDIAEGCGERKAHCRMGTLTLGVFADDWGGPRIEDRFPGRARQACAMHGASPEAIGARRALPSPQRESKPLGAREECFVGVNDGRIDVVGIEPIEPMPFSVAKGHGHAPNESVKCRDQAEHDANPTACIVDSQSVKAQKKGAFHRSPWI
jgi:hypothetical protein